MYSDNWSDKFLKDKLKNFDSAQEINSIEQNLVKVKRKKGPDFVAFIMSLIEIEYSIIKEICEKHPQINFIVNIKKQYNLSGESILYLSNKKISLGGLGDFMRFCNQDSNHTIEDKDFTFVSRGLRQHIHVSNIERIDNRRLKITRLGGLSEVIAIMINEYDITSESVRSAKDLYGDFQVVIKTNPNGEITAEAIEVAKVIGIDICKWGNFLGKLNSQWI